MKVMVTDGETRSALAVTRSLGKRGCRVVVVGSRKHNISAASRFCVKAFQVPDPMNCKKEYAISLGKIADREGIDVIFPMTEQSIYAANDSREIFGHAILACPTADKMLAVSDKSQVFSLAGKLGVPIPETIHIADRDHFLQGIHPFDFPVVVKPAYSKTLEEDKMVSAPVMYAANSKELRSLYETKSVLRHPSLIQELIVGEGTGLFTLFDRDRHLALFSHRRILEKPPSGGVSVLSESIALDDEMVRAAGELLSEIGWEGVAMVEFKRDDRDGKAKLMEINGRFWGSLQLAIASDMDFPSLCLDYYQGTKPQITLSQYRIGHKLKWFLGMLDHLIIRSKSNTYVPAGCPAPKEVLSELLKWDKNTSSDVYDRADLLPSICEVTRYLESIFIDRHP